MPVVLFLVASSGAFPAVPDPSSYPPPPDVDVRFTIEDARYRETGDLEVWPCFVADEPICVFKWRGLLTPLLVCQHGIAVQEDGPDGPLGPEYLQVEMIGAAPKMPFPDELECGRRICYEYPVHVLLRDHGKVPENRCVRVQLSYGIWDIRWLRMGFTEMFAWSNSVRVCTDGTVEEIEPLAVDVSTLEDEAPGEAGKAAPGGSRRGGR